MSLTNVLQNTLKARKAILALPERSHKTHELIQQKLIIYLNTVWNSDVF